MPPLPTLSAHSLPEPATRAVRARGQVFGSDLLVYTKLSLPLPLSLFLWHSTKDTTTSMTMSAQRLITKKLSAANVLSFFPFPRVRLGLRVEWS